MLAICVVDNRANFDPAIAVTAVELRADTLVPSATSSPPLKAATAAVVNPATWSVVSVAICAVVIIDAFAATAILAALPRRDRLGTG